MQVGAEAQYPGVLQPLAFELIQVVGRNVPKALAQRTAQLDFKMGTPTIHPEFRHYLRAKLIYDISISDYTAPTIT